MNNNKSLDDIMNEFVQQELSVGVEQVKFGVLEEPKVECFNWLHEYVNVGFHFDKFVCKVCNKEKPKE